MGIHIVTGLQKVMARTLDWAPPTTILASATLGDDWEALPMWWRGSQGHEAQRTVVTLVRLKASPVEFDPIVQIGIGGCNRPFKI